MFRTLILVMFVFGRLIAYGQEYAISINDLDTWNVQHGQGEQLKVVPLPVR